MMKCKDLGALTTEYFDRALGLADRVQFKIHMTACPSCRVHVQKMQQLISNLKSIPDDAELPEGMIERIMGANND